MTQHLVGNVYTQAHDGVELLTTTRAFGNMSNTRGIDHEHADTRRKRLFDMQGGRHIVRLVCKNQTGVVDAVSVQDDIVADGDAVICNLHTSVAIMLPADCPIVVLASPDSELGLMLHASRDTLQAGLVAEAVENFLGFSRVSLDSVQAILGPSVHPRRWIFSDENAAKLFDSSWMNFRTFFEDWIGFDIKERTKSELAQVGVRSERIFTPAIYTSGAEPGDASLFFSHSATLKSGLPDGLNAAVMRQA